jgi:hypothetical protein
MRLIVVHQILIASAIALATLFGVRALVLFARGEGALNLALALASAVIGAALALYLSGIRKKQSSHKDGVRGARGARDD